MLCDCRMRCEHLSQVIGCQDGGIHAALVGSLYLLMHGFVLRGCACLGPQSNPTIRRDAPPVLYVAS